MLKQNLLQKLGNTKPEEPTTKPSSGNRLRFPTDPSTTSTTTPRAASKLQPLETQRSPLTNKVQIVKPSATEFPVMEVNVESAGIFIKRVAQS